MINHPSRDEQMLVDARKEFYAAAEDNIDESGEDALYWGEMLGLTILYSVVYLLSNRQGCSAMWYLHVHMLLLGIWTIPLPTVNKE